MLAVFILLSNFLLFLFFLENPIYKCQTSKKSYKRTFKKHLLIKEAMPDIRTEKHKHGWQASRA